MSKINELVLNATGKIMGGPLKKEFENSINDKIQRKFDLIFDSAPGQSDTSNGNKSTAFNHGLDGDSSMSNNAKKESSLEKGSPKLDLDAKKDESSIEFENSESSSATVVAPMKAEGTIKLAVVPDDLEFTLDFGDDAPEVPSISQAEKGALEIPADDNADSNDDLDTMFDAAILESTNSMSSGTQKTIVYDASKMAELNPFELDLASNSNSSAELMSTEEAKANIESTIKDILRPQSFDSTQELDISKIDETGHFTGFSAAETIGFDLKSLASNMPSTGEFDLNSVEFSDEKTRIDIPSLKAREKIPSETHSLLSTSNKTHYSEEESSRVLATIRQLREEREELLRQMKVIKGDSRALEEDNLTLKAALDESRIEVSILRKRHLLELEDIKYRLTSNEEKKVMAEEKARQAIAQKEKLEQRVRIDFNQIKAREKELETKLEMLTIDVDSQVQSRDHKILELRRKIDSLEFNMENVSIKEHKSQDDKRKLEDKLNKIMKTLRHSIKNLEDDIDQATDESQNEREGERQNIGPRSGKA